MIRVGSLVRSQQNDLNIGKIVELSGERSATVRVFHFGFAKSSIDETISISALQRVFIFNVIHVVALN
jgi:hypothetical protein